MLKRMLALCALLSLVLAACVAPTVPGSAPAAAPEADEAMAEGSDNPYLDSVARRKGEMFDSSTYQKDGPYRIALAAQGPTNAWATLFDEHVRSHVEELGTDVVAELLYADASGSADVQVPQVEDLLSQEPDALILVPMGRAALSAPTRARWPKVFP